MDEKLGSFCFEVTRMDANIPRAPSILPLVIGDRRYAVGTWAQWNRVLAHLVENATVITEDDCKISCRFEFKDQPQQFAQYPVPIAGTHDSLIQALDLVQCTHYTSPEPVIKRRKRRRNSTGDIDAPPPSGVTDRTCGLCARKFSSKQALRDHTTNRVCQKNKKPASFVCLACGKKLGTKGALAYHVDKAVCYVSDPQKRDECQFCHASIKRKHMARHLRYYCEKASALHKEPSLMPEDVAFDMAMEGFPITAAVLVDQFQIRCKMAKDKLLARRQEGELNIILVRFADFCAFCAFSLPTSSLAAFRPSEDIQHMTPAEIALTLSGKNDHSHAFPCLCADCNTHRQGLFCTEACARCVAVGKSLSLGVPERAHAAECKCDHCCSDDSDQVDWMDSKKFLDEYNQRPRTDPEYKLPEYKDPREQLAKVTSDRTVIRQELLRDRKWQTKLVLDAEEAYRKHRQNIKQEIPTTRVEEPMTKHKCASADCAGGYIVPGSNKCQASNCERMLHRSCVTRASQLCYEHNVAQPAKRQPEKDGLRSNYARHVYAGLQKSGRWPLPPRFPCRRLKDTATMEDVDDELLYVVETKAIVDSNPAVMSMTPPFSREWLSRAGIGELRDRLHHLIGRIRKGDREPMLLCRAHHYLKEWQQRTEAPIAATGTIGHTS